jgi:Protein of unknown function (DUF2934)
MKDKHVARPTDEEIARKAYELFEARGRLPGHEREDWLAAEQQLQDERKPKPSERPRRSRGQSARPREI